MLTLTQLDIHPRFPDPRNALAEPNGLLAFGGDLSVTRLATAYQHGIFPWFNADEPILWWSPDPRAVIEIANFSISKSLRKLLRKNKFILTTNRAFEHVIHACARVNRVTRDSSTKRELPTDLASQTWITADMQQAYIDLHHAGYAHSIEAWLDGELIGGLYGVAVGGVFCGESMFHTVTNASKVATVGLVSHMQRYGMSLIDCQIQNSHLMTFGSKTISRQSFLKKLTELREYKTPTSMWEPQTLEISEVWL